MQSKLTDFILLRHSKEDTFEAKSETEAVPNSKKSVVKEGNALLINELKFKLKPEKDDSKTLDTKTHDIVPEIDETDGGKMSKSSLKIEAKSKPSENSNKTDQNELTSSQRHLSSDVKSKCCKIGSMSMTLQNCVS